MHISAASKSGNELPTKKYALGKPGARSVINARYMQTLITKAETDLRPFPGVSVEQCHNGAVRFTDTPPASPRARLGVPTMANHLKPESLPT